MAIFESIEFYASGIETQPLFTDEERDRSTDAAIAKFTDRQQRGRIKEVLGGLNQAPLGFRLKLALAEDDVPLTKGEMDLLWKKLRTLRNAIVHGKEVAVPETEDIDYATSMVARMLTYRAARHVRHAAAPGSPTEE